MLALVLCSLMTPTLDQYYGVSEITAGPAPLMTAPNRFAWTAWLFDHDYLGQYTDVMNYRIRVEIWADDDPFNEDYVFDMEFESIPWEELDGNDNWIDRPALDIAAPLTGENRLWYYTVRIDWADAYNQIIATDYPYPESAPGSYLQYGTY